MALSRIWAAFIIIAILAASYQAIFVKDGPDIYNKMVVGKTGDTSRTAVLDSASVDTAIINMLNAGKDVYKNNYAYKKAPNAKVLRFREQKADGIITTCKTAVDICISLIGVMALFMGFMSIAERAGGIRLLSKIIGPFFSKLFPEVPKGHPAMGHMMMNFSANLMGLDNAATPFGLKAMESLQEINPHKDTASNPQIMFMALHAAGLTLIPITIIAARAAPVLHSRNPTDIFLPCMIATFVATMAALLIVSFRQKINVFQPVILSWILGISAVIGAIVMYVNTLTTEQVKDFSGIVSAGLILLIFILIILGALYKGINIFDAFVDGAKGGFETAVRIIPYLVGMLVAISMLRTSGTFDVIIAGMKEFFTFLGADTRFVDGIPTALIRPLSGSGARGMMVDTMTAHGADSFPGRLACILQGSSDTTFYVIAVYFGSVSIKNTRYAIGSMLLADLVGIVTSIGLAYMFFG